MQYQTNTKVTGDQEKNHQYHFVQYFKYCHSYINYIRLKGGKKTTSHSLQQLHIMNTESCITGSREIIG